MHQQKWQVTVVKLSKCSELQVDVGEMPLSFSFFFVLGWTLTHHVSCGFIGTSFKIRGVLCTENGAPFIPFITIGSGGPHLVPNLPFELHVTVTSILAKQPPSQKPPGIGRKKHHSHDRTWDLNVILFSLIFVQIHHPFCINRTPSNHHQHFIWEE